MTRNTGQWAKFGLHLGIEKVNVSPLQGGFAPDTLTSGFASGPRWWLCPQNPVTGSRIARAIPLALSRILGSAHAERHHAVSLSCP